MTDPATETNNNNKRTRFAPNQAAPTNSALERAKFAATLPLASLPATIKTLATGYFTKFFELRVLLRSLDSTKSRLSQDDFVPHSARIKFELNASKRVKEKAGAEYQALAVQADVSLAVFKHQAKNQIVRLVDLEIKVIKNDVSIIFCRAVFTLACAMAIHHPTVDQANATDLVALVFEKHHDELLNFSEIDSAQAFFTLFRTANSIPTEAHEHETLSPVRQEAVEAAEDSLKNILHALFVRSWTAYLGVKAEQQRQLELQEFIETSFKQDATDPVSMELDTLTVESPALHEFIAREIAKNTKGLQIQVSSLQNKLYAKNQTPGANKPSARSSNKKGTVKNLSTRPKKGAAPTTALKADAAAKGSNDKRKNSGRQKQQPKKKKSRQPKPNSA
jgi:hypothetical protein